jgi:hypothetical protein
MTKITIELINAINKVILLIRHTSRAIFFKIEKINIQSRKHKRKTKLT